MTRDPLARVRRAVDRLEQARADVRLAITEAEAAGATQRQIAEAAGISQTSVWKILRDEEGH